MDCSTSKSESLVGTWATRPEAETPEAEAMAKTFAMEMVEVVVGWYTAVLLVERLLGFLGVAELEEFEEVDWLAHLLCRDG